MNYKIALKKQDIAEYIGDSKILALDIETSPKEAYRAGKKEYNSENLIDVPTRAQELNYKSKLKSRIASAGSAPSLDAHKSEITGISFSVSKGTGVYVPFRHKVGLNADFMDIWKWIKENILMNEDLIVVIHNAAFETMFFYALGCVPQCKVYDTLAAAQLTLKTQTEFRKLGDSGLKKLVPELLGVELPTFEDVTQGGCFDELNSNNFETVRYACADSDYALQLYHVFNEWFDKYMPKHRLIVEQIESPTAVYVGLMKYNGVPIDLGLMRRKGTEAEAQISQLKEDIEIMTDGINIGANASTKAFKDYLYKTLELPVLKVTEKFSEAADDEAMILLSQWCEKNNPSIVPIFKIIQEYRKWNKLKSTYIDGYLKFLNEATNRIHPNLMPLATATGRFASRNPNLQNCPRKDNDPIGIRNFIVAPIGKLLLSLDFSQIELRVGAFYCRDEKMLDTYRNNGDIHASTTSVIFNIPFFQAIDKNAEHYKERRTIAKNCNFGVFFGLFPKGLQRTLKFKAGLNKSIEECTEIIKNLKSGYSGLESWQRKVKKQASECEYSETYLGRRRYLVGINSADWGKKSFSQRCALNTPIQGTAADILKLAMGRIIKGLPERLWLKPILQIHDELVFEIPDAKVNEAVTFIKECMETEPFKAMDVPIIAEAEVGKTFGTLHELEGGKLPPTIGFCEK